MWILSDQLTKDIGGIFWSEIGKIIWRSAFVYLPVIKSSNLKNDKRCNWYAYIMWLIYLSALKGECQPLYHSFRIFYLLSMNKHKGLHLLDAHMYTPAEYKSFCSPYKRNTSYEQLLCVCPFHLVEHVTFWHYLRLLKYRFNASVPSQVLQIS